MKITRHQIRKIISERISPAKVKSNVLELGRKPNGVSLDTINSMYGAPGFDAIDQLEEEDRGILDEEEGVWYTYGSPGLEAMLRRRGL